MSVLRFVPLGLKLWLPGYRRRHYARHAAIIAAIGEAMERLTLGRDGAVPWIESASENLRLYGFETEPKNLELYDLLRPALPAALVRTHFRLVKDYVTRWMYPHMRPDLGPVGYTLDRLHGLHGQHKDNIAAYPDAAARARLARAFAPGKTDVALDCGTFLGFGAIHMARAAAQGRVYAVEANRACHALLCRNVEANGARNVEPIHRGVWNVKTKLALETTIAQGNSLVSEVQKGNAREPVQTLVIDKFVAERGLERLDMLSLTLNGAEVEALEGATETLHRLRPRIRAAGWYTRGDRRIADIIRPTIESAGYDVFVGARGNVMALPKERV